MRGRFITLEGVDGAGKSSHVQFVADTLSSGGRHVILRRFDPTALMAMVERHRVTRLLAVPTIFNAVLNSRERSRFDLSSLQQLIIGGSPASPDLVRALESELKTQAIVGYGLTETSPIITLAQPRQVLSESEAAERRLDRQSMTGWAIPGVTIRVVDVDGNGVAEVGRKLLTRVPDFSLLRSRIMRKSEA